MPNPVTWFEISGKDGKALHEYYANLFGWEIDANNPMNYGMFDNQGAGINGGIFEGVNRVTVYVEVDDMEATLQKAVDLGGTVIHPVTEIPDMVTFAQFADVAGNVIGIIKSQK